MSVGASLGNEQCDEVTTTALPSSGISLPPRCREHWNSGIRCLFFAFLVRALKGSVGRAVPPFDELSLVGRVQVDDFVPHCIQH